MDKQNLDNALSKLKMQFVGSGYKNSPFQLIVLEKKSK